MRAIAALVKAKGRSWLVYDECDRVDEARLDVAQVENSHELLNAAHDLAANLAFPKLTAQAMVQQLYDMYKEDPKWTIAAEHLPDHVSTMTKRCHMTQIRIL